MNKVLTISEGLVIVDENILCIPEFKAMYDYYKNKTGEDEVSIKAFTYLHYLLDPESPYSSLQEEEREDTIKKDFRGNFKPSHDKVFLAAKEKMAKLSNSPARRVLDAMKISLDQLSYWLATTVPTSGKDGNLADIRGLHKDIVVMFRNYNSIEADFKKETVKNRGNSRDAIDKDDTNEHF